MKKYKITILGGTGEFGVWLVKYILKNFQNNIEKLIITGRNKEKGEKFSKEIGCHFSDDNVTSSKNADIVVFGVSISQTEEIMKTVMPHLKKGALAIDITSIKKGPSRWMNKYAPKDVCIIPTHPMFGPYVSTISGQVFVLTPEEEMKKDERYIFFKDFLNSKGAKVIEETPKGHDQMMAVVQGLTHYSMFVMGKTIKRLGFDIQKSMKFVSPVYKTMLSLSARYIGQNPRLYSDIQIHNDEILKVQKIFIDVSKDFNKAILEKDEKTFTSYLENTKQYFGEENTKEGQEYTDKIIYMIGDQVRKIQENIGKEMKFKNIYSSELLVGKVKKFNGRKITLEKGKEIDINNWEIL